MYGPSHLKKPCIFFESQTLLRDESRMPARHRVGICKRLSLRSRLRRWLFEQTAWAPAAKCFRLCVRPSLLPFGSCKRMSENTGSAKSNNILNCQKSVKTISPLHISICTLSSLCLASSISAIPGSASFHMSRNSSYCSIAFFVQPDFS